MISDPKSMCWDSCVFIRYLTQSPNEYLTDITDFLEDAKNKKRRIFFSTLAFTEIKLGFLKKRGYGTIQDFFEDFQGAFEPVDPDPNILIAAGQLRDAIPINPGDPNEPLEKRRVIGTPDAIHLMTCLYVRDTLGVSDVVFHTFDKGKGKTWEGRCVPLLGFERWFPNPSPDSFVADVCGLTRLEPAYPQLRLAVSNL